jgi:hypothetical protein
VGYAYVYQNLQESTANNYVYAGGVFAATYDAAQKQWVSAGYVANYFVLNETPPITVIAGDGIVAWAYPTNPNLNASTFDFTIYDPVRHAWVGGGATLNGWGPMQIVNGQVVLSNGYKYGYNGATGTWGLNQSTSPVSAFSVGYPVNPAYPNTVWVTDMSVGASSTINWGDGTTGSGSGHHNYSTKQPYTITQTVTGYNGGTATSSAPAFTFAPTITTQPVAQTVSTGSPATFSVVATGIPAPTYQWYRNGILVPNGTGSSVTVIASPSDVGTYYCDVSNPEGSLLSLGVNLTISNTIPSFTTQPSSQTIASGSTVAFNAAATGAPTPTYQWYFNGSALSGATNPLLVVYGATSAGNYACIASNAAGSVTSATATLTVVASTNNNGRFVDLSVRGWVGTGNDVLIPGFWTGGAGTSGATPILVGALGPYLGTVGLSNYLTNPDLQLYNAQASLLASNTGWDSSLASLMSELGAPTLVPGSTDAAISTTLSPGGYSAIISGNGGGSGIALAEVFDASWTLPGGYTLQTPRLTSLSGRGFVGTGNNVLIGGIYIGGNTAKTVLIRASGPALSGLGLSGGLLDPTLSLHNSSGALMASNTGWGGNPQIVTAANDVYAFSWSTSSKDSALLVTLPPGGYTAEISGASGDTGLAMIEFYEVP